MMRKFLAAFIVGCFVCSMTVVRAEGTAAVASGDMTAKRLDILIGTGSNVLDVQPVGFPSPAANTNPTGSSPPCPSAGGGKLLSAHSRNDGFHTRPVSTCVYTSTNALSVQIPVAVDFPPTPSVNCLRIPDERYDRLAQIVVTVAQGTSHSIVECDLSYSQLYALSSEHGGSSYAQGSPSPSPSPALGAAPKIETAASLLAQQKGESRVTAVTVAIPWSTLRLKPATTNLTVAIVSQQWTFNQQAISSKSLAPNALMAATNVAALPHGDYQCSQTPSADVNDPALLSKVTIVAGASETTCLLFAGPTPGESAPAAMAPLTIPGAFAAPYKVTSISKTRLLADYLTIPVVVRQGQFVGGLNYAPRATAIPQATPPGTSTHAPVTSKAAPTPGPRLHDIGVDLSWDDQYNFVGAAFNQNDAAALTQKNASQIQRNSAMTIPSPPPLSPFSTLQTRAQSFFGVTPRSKGLDNALKLFDVAAFNLSSTPTLDSGESYVFASPDLHGSAFYGLEFPGYNVRAYSAAISFPTPEPQVAPGESAEDLSNSIKALDKLAVSTQNTQTNGATSQAPPPGAALAGIPVLTPSDETQFTPTSVAFQSADVLNGYKIDAVNEVSVNLNAYQNTALCGGSILSYCSGSLHILADYLQDRIPLNNGKQPVAALLPQNNGFIGESAVFTIASRPKSTGTQNSPSFFQVLETLGSQTTDPLFNPPLGSTSWLTSLDGPVAHVAASYATGLHATPFSLDLLGFRGTNVYGDAASQEGGSLTIPVGTFRITGGTQEQTLTNRIASLQYNGGSYSSVLFPTITSTPAPVGTPMHQVTTDFALIPPSFGRLAIKSIIGYQFGDKLTCPTPSPTTALTCAGSEFHRPIVGAMMTAAGITFGGVTSGGLANAGGPASNTFSGYSASFVNAPGSGTVFASGQTFIPFTAAYSNAAFVHGNPLPQRGSTIALQVYCPLIGGLFDVGAGYFNAVVAQPSSTSTGQAGAYVMLYFNGTIPQPSDTPPCLKITKGDGGK